MIKLDSPLPKDTLSQVWFKLAPWFRRRWRKCEKLTTTKTRMTWKTIQIGWFNLLRLAKLFWRRLYKHCHPYIYFPILPLFSFWYLCFEQIWVPFSQGCILPSLNENAWPCGSEGEYENVKNFTITTDKSQLTFLSGELKSGNVYTWLFGTVW